MVVGHATRRRRKKINVRPKPTKRDCHPLTVKGRRVSLSPIRHRRTTAASRPLTPLEVAGVHDDLVIEVIDLGADLVEVLVLSIDLGACGRGEDLQPPGDGGDLVEIVIELLLDLIIRVCRLELVAASLLPLCPARRLLSLLLPKATAFLCLTETLFDPDARVICRPSRFLALCFLIEMSCKNTGILGISLGLLVELDVWPRKVKVEDTGEWYERRASQRHSSKGPDKGRGALQADGDDGRRSGGMSDLVLRT